MNGFGMSLTSLKIKFFTLNLKELFSVWDIYYNHLSCDLYFIGIKINRNIDRNILQNVLQEIKLITRDIKKLSKEIPSYNSINYKKINAGIV